MVAGGSGCAGLEAGVAGWREADVFGDGVERIGLQMASEISTVLANGVLGARWA